MRDRASPAQLSPVALGARTRAVKSYRLLMWRKKNSSRKGTAASTLWFVRNDGFQIVELDLELRGPRILNETGRHPKELK